MFTAVLFTIAKTQEQPKCPSTHEWIKKEGVYIYNGMLFHHKKEGNPDNMNESRVGILLCEISQIEKDKYCMISLLSLIHI